LERAAKLSTKFGSGSLSALPVVETQGGDLSSYVPTNIISITDGQIFLENDLFKTGVKPAVNVGLSISRVGSAAQYKAMRAISGVLRLELAQYRECAAFAFFASELDDTTKNILQRGEVLVSLLKQKKASPVPAEFQFILLFLGIKGVFDSYNLNTIEKTVNFLLFMLSTTNILLGLNLNKKIDCFSIIKQQIISVIKN